MGQQVCVFGLADHLLGRANALEMSSAGQSQQSDQDFPSLLFSILMKMSDANFSRKCRNLTHFSHTVDFPFTFGSSFGFQLSLISSIFEDLSSQFCVCVCVCVCVRLFFMRKEIEAIFKQKQ
jgi:hypothetical protein